MTNKKRYISYSPRPVATKFNRMVADDKGKFYIELIKCTRSLSTGFTDLVKNHYAFKIKRLAKKIWLKRIPETKKFLRKFLTSLDKEVEFKELSFQ